VPAGGSGATTGSPSTIRGEPGGAQDDAAGSEEAQAFWKQSLDWHSPAAAQALPSGFPEGAEDRLEPPHAASAAARSAAARERTAKR
jgi:hypothetical protein